MSIKDDRNAFPSQHSDGDGIRWHDGMTLRQYAAIHLRVPNSGTDWLDEMIVSSVRQELAAKAMSGQLAFSPPDPFKKFHQPEDVARVAYEFADAMLKAREVQS